MVETTGDDVKHTVGFRRTEVVGTLSRDGSQIFLPAVRIRKRAAICYAIILFICIGATVDTLRTFVIKEKALLTPQGRQNYRTRRRTYDKMRMCDENDEPTLWKSIFHSGWRSLSSCVEYNLSLRKRQLGDKGVKKLVSLLGRKEYAKRDRRGQLRVLNLERQGITRRGAGYLARWLSVDPVEATNTTSDLVDIDRMPTAAFRSIFINLEGNPIGILGVKDLERAVEKARINGIKVTIVGGGSSSDDVKVKGNGGRHQHVVKLGPIEYTRKSVEMPPWRLPVPLIQRIIRFTRAHQMHQSLRIIVVLCVGVAIGRTTAGITLPYRIAIVRSSDLLESSFE